MNMKDKLMKFQAYALTNMTSVYNEDSMTAQQLNIVNANKIKECLVAVSDLTEAIENIKAYLDLNYNNENEELEVTLTSKITDIKTQVNNSYVAIFNEDAMTSLELAGCTAKAVNECLKAINMLSDLVLDFNNYVTLVYDPNEEMLITGGVE